MAANGFLSKTVRFLVKVILGLFILSVLWVFALKYIPVTFTPLTIYRSIQYRGDDSFHSTLKWRSYRNISAELAKAVIASEDNLFEYHKGFDWTAILQAVGDHKAGKRLRGASTISQQTAKNVFCIPSPSFVRKAVEAYFTFLIENIWGKERILEVYLNVAEMGKGIYGAEAASRHYFSCHASELTQRQACLLAACLPAPLKRDPSNPTRYISLRAKSIASLEAKLSYTSRVLQKELSEEELAKEKEQLLQKRKKIAQRQKDARKKLLKT